jgi:hypothetical protein
MHKVIRGYFVFAAMIFYFIFFHIAKLQVINIKFANSTVQ